MIVYISSPYSIGDQILNVRRQIDTADRLLELGHIPFVPCLSHFWHYLSPKMTEEWLRIDAAFVARCDAVLRLKGISTGADLEVAIAEKLGIPVYHTLDEIPDE